MKLIKIISGSVLVLVALLLLGLEFIAIMDPVGTQLSNDNDPLGTPPPWYSHILPLAIFAGTSYAAYRFLSSSFKEPLPQHPIKPK
jgi:hypothetical protein